MRSPGEPQYKEANPNISDAFVRAIAQKFANGYLLRGYEVDALLRYQAVERVAHGFPGHAWWCMVPYEG